MTYPIRFPFNPAPDYPAQLDEHEAEFDDNEVIRVTKQDMLDRLAVCREVYTPQPARKSPMFWQAVAGLLCICIAAVGLVLGIATIVGRFLS